MDRGPRSTPGPLPGLERGGVSEGEDLPDVSAQDGEAHPPWKEVDVTIRLTGYEALSEAYYADRNRNVLANTIFYLRCDGGRLPLAPFQVLKMAEQQKFLPEDLVCLAPSVWDYLLGTGEPARLFRIHPSSGTALVLTKDHGVLLTEGIRGFAVVAPVFERAARWAKNAPVTDPDHDWLGFLGRLLPRLPLRVREWQENGELERHATEIAETLIDLFGLDRQFSAGEFRTKALPASVEEAPLSGGSLLDAVLERLRRRPWSPGNDDLPGGVLRSRTRSSGSALHPEESLHCPLA